MKRKELSESESEGKNESRGESESSEEDVLKERSSLEIYEWNVHVLEKSSSWESLVELKLGYDVTFLIPSDGRCFPSLKILYVGARHPNCEFLNKLFGICQVLEDLTVYGDLEYGVDEYNFIISIPTLKKLRIELIADAGFQHCSDHRFIIRIPKLEDLTIHDATLAHYEIDEMSSLLKATVGIGCSYYFNKGGDLYEEDYQDRVDPILQGIRHAKFLHLTADTTAALSRLYDDDDEDDGDDNDDAYYDDGDDDDGFPTFPNLERLELGIDHFYQWKLLPDFLRSSSNLEFLELQKESEAMLTSELNDEEILLDWEPPKFTPSSVVRLPQSLKEISIRNLWKSEDDFAVVKFFLEKCKGLKKMPIQFDD